MATDELIYDFLQPVQPKSVLAVGPSSWLALEHYCKAESIAYHSWDIEAPLLKVTERYDLSVVYDFEGLDKMAVRSQLGVLKNLASSRVWAIAPETSAWTLTDFVELGFVRDKLPPEVAAASYSYNLATYNHQREWNSPRYWANPQRWYIRF